MNTNQAYVQAIRDCVSCGYEVSPRGMLTYECIQHTVTFDMTSPVITIPERELDYQFMVAEAHWILSGDDKLNDFIRKNLEKYSDDGITMNGAYGKPFVEQLVNVVETLRRDRESRQAVMTIWQRNPKPSKDIPCTVAMQWLIRDGMLHCNVFMRSQDVWLGLPYDLFSFSMMSAYLLLGLNTLGAPIKLGTINITAGSRHLYSRHAEKASYMCADGDTRKNLIIDIHKVFNPGVLLTDLDVIRQYPNDRVLSRIKVYL